MSVCTGSAAVRMMALTLPKMWCLPDGLAFIFCFAAEVCCLLGHQGFHDSNYPFRSAGTCPGPQASVVCKAHMSQPSTALTNLLATATYGCPDAALIVTAVPAELHHA